VRKPLATVALLGLLAGCTTTPPKEGERGPALKDEGAEQAYQSVLARYTSRQEIYDGFDTRLFAGATLQTPAFREARVRRKAAFQSLPQPRVDELLAQERADAAQAHTFFLGTHANDYNAQDFDFKKSIWRVALVTPAGEVTPTRIVRLGRSDLEMRAYYPYTGEFWVGYEVRFPLTFANGQPVIPPGTEQVTLRLASSLGKADLTVNAQ
jgi:hypothetical protein